MEPPKAQLPYYVSLQYPLTLEDVTRCYICGNQLSDSITTDHVIPDALFHKDDRDRPQLRAHKGCNNRKSKEDEWFIRQLQLRCSFNVEAEQEFSKMMDKAIQERPKAYIIGEKLHSYKLAKGIFNKVNWGLEIKHMGTSAMQMRIDKSDVDRFHKYLETMCRGLFIRNVPKAQPVIPKLIYKQYKDLDLRQRQTQFIQPVSNLIEMSKSTKFGQKWGDRIMYIGSPVAETPDKGFIFIQFYSQFGILAFFDKAV